MTFEATTSPTVPVGPLLVGRTAIVTGGGGGMGRGISEAFADHGANVVIAEIDAERADEVATSIKARGGSALAVVSDVRERADCERIVAATLDTFGAIDVLVNNVGHYGARGAKPFQDTTEEEWEAIHAVNFLHVLRMTHVALPHMIERGQGGSIINVTTVEAYRGLPHRPVYGAYKAAAAHFSRSLAVDVGKYGIRVNDLAPDMTVSLQLPLDTLLTDEERAAVPLCIPIGRLGVPADSGGVAVFLASDLSAYVTGTCLHQDGGTLASSGWFRANDGRREWTNMPRHP
jgi:NAD(P)-dependent dehydrogenase (short-subunit alcohol dehydrogenase family)